MYCHNTTMLEAQLGYEYASKTSVSSNAECLYNWLWGSSMVTNKIKECGHN